MTPEGAPLRIGTTERSAAMKALDEHLAAGRLSVEEYAERSAVAAKATHGPELAALFTDLPAPHPELPGIPSFVPPMTAPLPMLAPSDTLAERGSSFLAGWGPRLVAVMPFIAIGLFLITRHWAVFLLIPAAGALVYGGGVGRDPDSRRNRD